MFKLFLMAFGFNEESAAVDSSTPTDTPDEQEIVQEELVSDYTDDSGKAVPLGQEDDKVLPDPTADKEKGKDDLPAKGADDKEVKPDDKPSAIDDLLFSKDDKGEATLNTSELLNFVKSDPDNIPTPIKPGTKTDAKSGDGEPAWKKDLKVEQDFRTKTREDYLKGPGLVRKLAKEYPGATVDQITAEADRILGADLEAHFQERDAEAHAKREERFAEQLSGKTKQHDLQSDSQSNIASVAKANGGMKMFEDLLFSNKFGHEILNGFFDRDNPDHGSLNKEQIQERFSEWWTKFTASSADLKMATKFAKLNVLANNMEKIVKTGKTIANKENAARRGAPKGGASGLNNQSLQTEQSSGDVFDQALGLSAPDSVN